MSRLTVPVNKRDHIQGSKNAPVALVEYGDYECPYCGQAYPIIKRLQQLEGDILQFVFRNFPLTQAHPHALHAAYAAEAAGKQGKFWQMHDILYENQEALSDHDILMYAKEIGLDTRQFGTDVTSEDVEKKVQEDFLSGVRSGVNGTPTFFINGMRYDQSYELESLQGAVNQSAKQKGATV